MSAELPWWVVAAGTAVAAAVGLVVGGVALPVLVAAATVLAALLCERSAMFTVLAQPPLVTAAAVTVAVLFGKPLLSGITELSATFPYLLATMVAVALIVLFRSVRGRPPRTEK